MNTLLIFEKYTRVYLYLNKNNILYLIHKINICLINIIIILLFKRKSIVFYIRARALLIVHAVVK